MKKKIERESLANFFVQKMFYTASMMELRVSPREASCDAAIGGWAHLINGCCFYDSRFFVFFLLSELEKRL